MSGGHPLSFHWGMASYVLGRFISDRSLSELGGRATSYGRDCRSYPLCFFSHLCTAPFLPPRDRTRQSRVRAFSRDLPRENDWMILDDITSLEDRLDDAEYLISLRPSWLPG